MAPSAKNCNFCHHIISVPRKGWRLRDSTYAKLCDTCFFAYNDGSFCQKYHNNEDGWRKCNECDRKVHLGCIMSLHLFETDDTIGVTCKECLEKKSLKESIVGSSISTPSLDSCSYENVLGQDLLEAIGNAIEYAFGHTTIPVHPTTSGYTFADLTAEDAPADPTTKDAFVDPFIFGDDHSPAIWDAVSDLTATVDVVVDPATGDVPIIGDATHADPVIGAAFAHPTIIGDASLSDPTTGCNETT